MPRARNLKPGFFKNHLLAKCDPLARLLFEGLWCWADADGKLEEIVDRLKIEILPYDQCDIVSLLEQLASQMDADGSPALITRYSCNGFRYIKINNFRYHQNPHIKEPSLGIPDPLGTLVSTNLAPDKHSASTVQAPDKHSANSPVSLLLSPSTVSGYTDNFEATWCDYPNRHGGNPKKPAYTAWCARVKEGANPDELHLAVKGYKSFCTVTGKIDTEFVMRGSRFFGPNEEWRSYSDKERKDLEHRKNLETEPDLPVLTDKERKEQLEQIRIIRKKVGARK